MTLLEMMYNRRSVRKYTGESVSDEALQQVLAAGLLAASGKNIKPWEFVVVKNKETLEKLAECRVGSVPMIKTADAVIVVLAKEDATDVWVEDCSVAMANMHLMADSLGLGSCWVQGRLRPSNDERMAKDVVREVLNVPDTYEVEAILTLGVPAEKAPAYTEADLKKDKVHYETF